MNRFIQILLSPISIAFLLFTITFTSQIKAEDYWFGKQIAQVQTDEWQSYIAMSSTNLDSNEIEIVRNYKTEINLGIDPVSGIEWYPHKSVKVKYMTDCINKKVAMQSWKLYSKQNARGDVVWADEDFAIPHYYQPMIKDERIALENVCEIIKTAKK
tara:strand:- start:119 stop:589 length:471 start_codon:yes stop_codon:yes gene_type:complete